MFGLFKNKRKFFLTTLSLIFAIGAFLWLAPVFAQTSSSINFGLNAVKESSGLGGDDIRLTIARIIRAVLGLLGIVTVVIMMWGGYTIMTAGGNEEKVAEGKKILMNATIGLAIILSSFAITQFILTKLMEATNPPPSVSPSDLCKDIDFYNANVCDCAVPKPSDCESCLERLKAQGVFVAQSITPVTNDTHMNNVSVRTLFNLGIGSEYSANQVLKVFQGNNDYSDKFDYTFLTDKWGKKIGVEAVLNSGAPKCPDNTPCLDGGNYTVSITSGLKAENGKTIVTATNCGNYPIQADFRVANGVEIQPHNSIVFDGVDDYVQVREPKAVDGVFEDWSLATTFYLDSDSATTTALFQSRMYKDDSGTLFPGGSNLLKLTKQPGNFYEIASNFQHKNVGGIGDNSYWFITNTDFLNKNSWNEIVMTVDSGTITLYVNGKIANQVVVDSNITRLIKQSGDLFYHSFGGYLNGSEYLLKGKIDKFVMYKKALTTTQITSGNYGNSGDTWFGFDFNQETGIDLVDLNKNVYIGALKNGTTWNFSSVTYEKVKDIEKPILSALKINDNSSVDQDLEVQRGYSVSSDVVDNSGVGYGHLKLIRELDGQLVADYYNGPTVSRGSNASSSNPFVFNSMFIAPKASNTPPDRYILFLEVFDIDYNFRIVTTTFTVGAQRPPGSPCASDWQCTCGLCERDPDDATKKVCSNKPQILEIDPMNGATGNWLTISGKCFTNTSGVVEFAYDNNKSGVITETDNWTPAPLAICGNNRVWNDKWVIVSVPNDINLPTSTTSSVRLTLKNSTIAKPLIDYSNDVYGPDLGLFEKNNIKRPGLCSVKVDLPGEPIDDSTAAVPKTPIKVFGTGLSTVDILTWGGIQTPFTIVPNSNVLIKTKVAENLSPGFVAVKVSDNGQVSNGIPFKVSPDTNPPEVPVIDSIDPASTTKKSFITIYGHGFGDAKGAIYVSTTSLDYAKTCANGDNLTPGFVCPILTLDLGLNCGLTWQDKQVIAEVPEGLLEQKYYVVLENRDNLYSKENVSLTVLSGPPRPSICSISPSKGPAPLFIDTDGTKSFITVSGKNFSTNPKVFYWRKTSQLNVVNTWFNSDNFNGLLTDITDTEFKTLLPYSPNTGESVVTGPIKIYAEGSYSNSVKYEVIDCRDSGMELSGFSCCYNDGPDQGTWKPNGMACAGEERQAGYAWRFTTGKIKSLPEVREICNGSDYPSPVPSVLWKKGKEACVNSTVAVRFTEAMNNLTLNFNTVKLYKCDNVGNSGVCTGKTLVDGINYSVSSGNTLLELHQTPPDLDLNTWYHVELSDQIMSIDCTTGGVQDCSAAPLKKSKPCGNGTAYCFNFRTGSEKCTLKDAGILPPSYTATMLGWVWNPAFPATDDIIGVNFHPYDYLLWGRGSQECSVLNVDKLNWNWQTSSSTLATVEKYPTQDWEDQNKIYTNSRAKVFAVAETDPANPVFVTARTEQDQMVVSSTAGIMVTSSVKQLINATSTLWIDLSPPKIIKWWPNCQAVCINAGLGFQFNRKMLIADFNTTNFVLNKCTDESCGVVVEPSIPLEVDGAPSDYIIRFFPKLGLSSSTWYRVEVKGGPNGVHALGRLNPPISGKPMTENFYGKFKTKADDTPCVINSVAVRPDPFFTSVIGQRTSYSVIPRGNPDQCSVEGQEINPWWYGWKWSVDDFKVATTTHFKTSSSTVPGCGRDCLLTGSLLGMDKLNIPLCGNGVLDAGEDCDVAIVGEISGVSCATNCLRPGNGQASCGDGVVSSTLGEECDKNDSAEGQNCNSNCTHMGATSSLFSSVCGSGEIGPGEDCDGGAGCSDKCLNLGTPNIRTIASMCGNGILEVGEECEIVKNFPSSLVIRDNNNQAVTFSGIGSAVKYCSNNCLLQNTCDLKNKNGGAIKTNNLWCEAGSDGCKSDCTPFGSSVLFIEPSVCGDGTVGTGEYGYCEPSEALLSGVPENPFQQVKSVGLGAVSPISKSQTTKINAVVTHFLNPNGWQSLGTKQKTGSGDYSLQCGFFEYKNPSGAGLEKRYNGCVVQNSSSTLFGVANNTCCYERPYRTGEYPIDRAGFGSDVNPEDLVCRNTYIAVKFGDHFIDEASLSGNLIIAEGHKEDNYNCGKNGEIKVNNLVNLATSNGTDVVVVGDSLGSLWHRIWNKIKVFVLGLFGSDVQAEYTSLNNIRTWCSGSITVQSRFFYEWSPDLQHVTTTVSLYLDRLLSSSTVYGVILQGGYDGLKDNQGVGIRNPDPTNPELMDAWFFATGNEVCRLNSVSVVPDKQLFSTQNSSFNFQALTKSTNGQLIVPIFNVYSWNWSWQPQGNAVFDIPVLGTPMSTSIAQIGAKNIEGHVVAVANAEIDADFDIQDSQLGVVLSGITDLTAKFCANVWPAPIGFPFEDGVGFGKALNTSGFTTSGIFNGSVLPDFSGESFNFRMNYCADAGQANTKTDDLPILRPLLFMNTSIQDTLKTCSASGDPCFSDAECSPYKYNIPNFEIITETDSNSFGRCKYGDNFYKYPATNETKSCLMSGADSCDSIAFENLNPEAKFLDGKRFSEKMIVSNGIMYSGFMPEVGGKKILVSTQDFLTASSDSVVGQNEGVIPDFDVNNNQVFTISAYDKKVRIYENDIGTGIVLKKEIELNFSSGYPITDYVIYKIKFSDGKLYIFGYRISSNRNVFVSVIKDLSNYTNTSVEWSHQFDVQAQTLDFDVSDGKAYLLATNSLITKVDTTINPGNEAVSNFTIAKAQGELSEVVNTQAYKLFIYGGDLFVARGTNYLGNKRGYIIKYNDLEGNNHNSTILVDLPQYGLGEFKIVNDKLFIVYEENNGLHEFKLGMYNLLTGNKETAFVLNPYNPASGGISEAMFDVIGDYLFYGPAEVFGTESVGKKITKVNYALLEPASCASIKEYSDRCVGNEIGLFINSNSFADDILRRYIFFNDLNDDAIGVQIFKNDDRQSAMAWLKDSNRFPEAEGFRSASVAGYDAITNGTDYYVNALNEQKDGQLKNRIYSFSFNADAQENTKTVFNQLLSSLEFNINISDFGMCLVPEAILQSSVTNKSCESDYNCRNSVGTSLIGTNGICSMDQTKLKRDLERIKDFVGVRDSLSAYYKVNGKYPDLKSGTFVNGYTVSKWPSWGKLSTEVKGLPTEKLNNWLGCDPKADQQTCWDTASSTYYCPNYSSVYEYEYASSTKSYIFHAPLEYLDVGSDLFQFYLPDWTNLTTDPWCPPGQTFTTTVGACGNGVINAGEACDPIWSTAISTEGYKIAKKGFCKFGTEKLGCSSDLECVQSVLGVGRTQIKVNRPPYSKVCFHDNYLLIAKEPIIFGMEAKVFDCETEADCKQTGKYGDGKLIKINTTGQDFSPLEDDLEPISLFTCDKVGDSSMYVTSTLPQTCDGKIDAGFGLCPENTQAYTVCNNSCQWNYSSCNNKFNCGNGIVEAGEDCDDGKLLNGKYGHCASDCGFGIQTCGDGKVNTTTIGNKPLEFCDKNEVVYQKGYCQELPGHSCLSNDECISKCNNPNGVPGQGKCTLLSEIISNIHSVSCNTDVDCNSYNIGSCESFGTSDYDYLKERTCSWDCQSRAGYCGDGIKQSLEECDDGNKTDLDGCNQYCWKENFECLSNITQYVTSTTNTYIYLSDISEPLPPRWSSDTYFSTSSSKISSCFENEATGSQICRAAGTTCENTKCVGEVFGSVRILNRTCDEALSGIVSDESNFTCGVQCSEVLKLNISLSESEIVIPPSACGNEIIEKDSYTNTSTGKTVKEICDMGKLNGVKCTAWYNSTCSYCSGDCQEILYSQSNWYCGDGLVTSNGIVKNSFSYEACDTNSNGKIVVKNGTGLLAPTIELAPCVDKGQYVCQNKCTKLVNNCVDCRFNTTVGVVPNIRLVNVMSPYTTSPDYFLNSTMLATGIIFKYGTLDSLDDYENLGTLNNSTLNNKEIPMAGTNLLNTNTMCNAPGKSYWIGFSSNKSFLNKDSLFPYSVSGQNGLSDKLVNDYIITPPVGPGQFRVVLKWGKEYKNEWFGGTVFNKGFSVFGGQSPLSVFNLTTGSFDDYGVEHHDPGYLGDTYFRATTIDTNKWDYKTNYAFTVQQFSRLTADGLSILPFTGSDLSVEVYSNDNVEDGGLTTVYGPTQVFKIKDVVGAGSADASAQYWHVFDLIYNSITFKFDVVRRDKINVDQKAVNEDFETGVINLNGGSYSLLSGGMDVGNFFNDKSLISTSTFGDIAVVVRGNPFYNSTNILKVFDDENKELELKTCDNSIFSIPSADQYNFIDVYRCSQEFASSATVNQIFNVTDNEVISENSLWKPIKPRPFSQVYFNRLENEKNYHYVVKFFMSNSPAFIKENLLKPGDLSYADDSSFLKTFVGFGNNGNEFELNQNENSNRTLNYEDLNSMLDEATQWHIFDVKKSGNNIYLKIKNTFLGTLVEDYNY